MTGVNHGHRPRPDKAATQGCSQGSGALRPLYGQVLPLLCVAARCIFREDDTWYLLVHTVCRHLQDNNMCGIYETRPQVCRDYSTKDCEYEDDWTYDFYLERPEQVAEYCEATLQDEYDTIRSPKPALLPILR